MYGDPINVVMRMICYGEGSSSKEMRNGKVLCILSCRCYSYFVELHECLVVLLLCGDDASSLMCAVVRILHACCGLLVLESFLFNA